MHALRIFLRPQSLKCLRYGHFSYHTQRFPSSRENYAAFSKPHFGFHGESQPTLRFVSCSGWNMSLVEDKRSEFVRRAALHSSRQSIGIPTDLRDGSAKRTVLRKRVSYPLSSKANITTKEMASTLPIRKSLMRRSVGGLSSSTTAVDLFNIRPGRASQSAKKLVHSDKISSEKNRSENVEPNCEDRLPTEPNPVEKEQSSMGGERPAGALNKEGNEDVPAVSSNKTDRPVLIPESNRSNSNGHQLGNTTALPEILTSVDSDRLKTSPLQSASVVTTSPLSSETQACPSEPSISEISAPSGINPTLNGEKPMESIHPASDSGTYRPEANSPLPSVIASSHSVEKQISSGESISPLSTASSSNGGSEELNRIVEMFRQSNLNKQKSSRPASTPQSPSSISSNRSVYSPADEQRIKNRLVEDEWKRRARTAEDALAKIRRELHQAESTYEEVLKKCSEETKEAVTRLNKSLDEEQAKVLQANLEARLAEADMQRARQEAKRANTIAKGTIYLLIMVILIIIYDNFWRPSSYCS